MKKMLLVLIGLSIGLLSLNSKTFAQQKESKTIQTKQDSTAQRQFKLRMDAIEIRGWIEKPQAIFVLQGVNPEVDDIGLNRTFVDEILRPLDKDKFEKQKVRKRKTVIPW
jgi:hypothetical protein